MTTITTLEPMNWWQRFTHNILGWASPSSLIWSDTFNTHAQCRFCSKHIMKDSQGNWFHAN